MAESIKTVKWVHLPDKSLRSGACYADSLYHAFFPGEIFETYFRIHKYKITHIVANWWLKEFLLPIVPKRCHDAIKLAKFKYSDYKTWDQHWKELDGPKTSPWLTVTIDPSKISIEDAYCFLTLVRYPQENPTFAWQIYNLWKQYNGKLRPEQAFIAKSWSDDPNENWHALMSTYSCCGDYKDYARDYSMKEVWEDLVRRGRSWLETNSKQDVQTQFYIGVDNSCYYTNKYEYGRGKIPSQEIAKFIAQGVT